MLFDYVISAGILVVFPALALLMGYLMWKEHKRGFL